MEGIFELAKKHRALTIIIASLVFFVPLIVVHLLFKWKTNIWLLESEWTAGDAIAYIAGVEAFMGTVIFSALALYQNQIFKKENDKAQNRLQDAYDKLAEANAVMAESQRLLTATQMQMQELTAQANQISLDMLNIQKERYKPLLFVQRLNRKIRTNLFGPYPSEPQEETERDEENNIYEEYLVRDYYVIVEDEISYKTELDKSQQNNIRSGLKWTGSSELRYLVSNKIIYIPLTIKNIGFGPCVDARFSFYKSEEKASFIRPFSLMSGDDFYVGIYADLNKKSNFTRFTFELIYKDVYLRQYTQKYNFEFFEENGRLGYSQTLQTSQIIKEPDT